MSLKLSSSNSTISITGYRLLEKLGSGSYSTVYKASLSDNPKQYVAIKCIELKTLSQNGQDNIINEIQIMKLLNHDYVIKLLDFQWDNKYIYLILEYCEIGDLSSFIKRKRRLSEDVFLKFLQQLALGLQFLRSNNVSHFDLKPQNLLLTKCPKLTLKIGDFGFAQFLSPDSLKTSIRGSPLYMAPEMLLHQKYSSKADLWSVGVISYQCVFGTPPFPSSSLCDIMKNHKNENPIMIPDKIVSRECNDLISRLLVYDPDVRIDFDEFFSHIFLDLEHYPSEQSYPKAVRLAQEAVKLDFEKHYKKSFIKYCNALQFLVPYVKELESGPQKELIMNKVLEYTNRAEELKRYHAQDIGLKIEEYSSNSSKENAAESASVESSNNSSLESACCSTPSLMPAIEMGKVGYMYLIEGKYTEALENLQAALSIAIPAVKSEPNGCRKNLLIKQVQDWLTAAENIKVILSVKKTEKTKQDDINTQECQDGCVIQ